MAIISIPTSIGGVTIPGSVVNGPLGSLFGNKYGLTSLKYPSDLGSATRGHYIHFSINEINPISFSTDKESDWAQISNPTQSDGIKDTTTGVSAGPAVIPATIQAVKNGVAAVTTFFDEKKLLTDNSTLTNFVEKVQQELSERKKRGVASISLYMPDTVNFNYHPSYNNTSLLDAIGATAKNLAEMLPGGNRVANMLGSAVSSFAPLAPLLLKSQGLALNPNQQVLFDGIDFRTYQLAFTFTPISKDEANSVKEIIKMFRKHAAPRIQTGIKSMFFIPPSTFDLKFMFNGKENGNITRVAESVITNIDVNYAPNGWAAHTDGAPVQTTLTMDFKEIELVDRNRIEKGGL